MSDLSLFDIERGLHDLFDAWTANGVKRGAELPPDGSGSAPPVPSELRGAMERIRKAANTGEQIKKELMKIGDLMIERAGPKGSDEYERVTKEFKAENPDPKAWRPAMIDGLLVTLWNAYQALPEPDPRPFGGQ